MQFSTIQEAITDIQRGKFVIIVDDENRENEADLVISAEKITPSKTTFLIKKASGLICVPMKKERLDELEIPLMVSQEKNTEITKCKFTISVDYKNGTTTGISSNDRTTTIKALADLNSKPEDYSKPGHIFPLQYTEGGVLTREGHTEAAIDICELANLPPVAVICEVLKDNGETIKLDDLEDFSKKHNIKVISIEDLIKYRKNL